MGQRTRALAAGARRILYLCALIPAFSAYGVATAAAGGAFSGSYLFEELRKPEYKATFDALFAGENNLEPWLVRYLEKRDGVDAPGETHTFGEVTYEVYTVCQPHNCPGNFLYVLFEPGGGRAWALFTKDDGSFRFFGRPDAATEAALRSVAREIH